MKSNSQMLMGVLIGVFLLTAPAFAQQKKAPSDAAVAQSLRKAQGMLQQLADENERLNQQLKALDAQVNQLAPKAKRFDALEAESTRQQAGAQAVREQNKDLVERANRDAERIKELQEQLGLAKQDNTLLVQAVQERAEWVDGCANKNNELLLINRELVERYNNKGIWQALKGSEPVTQIGRVQQEAEAQSYRIQLDKLRVTKWRGNE